MLLRLLWLAVTVVILIILFIGGGLAWRPMLRAMDSVFQCRRLVSRDHTSFAREGIHELVFRPVVHSPNALWQSRVTLKPNIVAFAPYECNDMADDFEVVTDNEVLIACNTAQCYKR